MKKRPSRLLRVLTNSERTSSACGRRWWWRYHLGFSGFDSPAPLRQGSLIHRMLAAWYLSNMTMTAVDIARDVADVWMQERVAYGPKNLPADVVGERYVEDLQIRDQSVAIVAHYLLHWGDHDRAAWEIVAVEASFARGIPHPKTGKSILHSVGGGPKKLWVHGGQVDLLIRERATGLLWFVEHKSTTDDDFEGFFSKLHLDTQIRGYAWALQDPIDMGSLFTTSVINEPTEVAGVIYNAIRKVAPRQPKLLKPPKATTKNPHPVSPGLSKAAIDTTRDVYLTTILMHGFDPGEYADILADLEKKRFFARERYVITRRELEDWIVDHGRWALETLERSKRPLDNPPSRQTSLCNEYHRRCEYASLCIEDGLDARRSFRVRTVRHEELPGDLGEPSALAERVALGIAKPDGSKAVLDPVERLQESHARIQAAKTAAHHDQEVGPDPWA